MDKYEKKNQILFTEAKLRNETMMISPPEFT